MRALTEGFCAIHRNRNTFLSWVRCPYEKWELAEGSWRLSGGAGLDQKTDDTIKRSGLLNVQGSSCQSMSISTIKLIVLDLVQTTPYSTEEPGIIEGDKRSTPYDPDLKMLHTPESPRIKGGSSAYGSVR